MASGAASETILFIGSMVAAAAIATVLGVVAQDLAGGLRDRGDALSKELGTDIAIINDPLAVATTPLTIYVKNTGGTTLATSLTNLFLNGVPSTTPVFDVLNSADDTRWPTGEVLKISANDFNPVPANQDNRVRVVTETGIEADFRFRS